MYVPRWILISVTVALAAVSGWFVRGIVQPDLRRTAEAEQLAPDGTPTSMDHEADGANLETEIKLNVVDGTKAAMDANGAQVWTTDGQVAPYPGAPVQPAPGSPGTWTDPNGGVVP